MDRTIYAETNGKSRAWWNRELCSYCIFYSATSFVRYPASVVFVRILSIVPHSLDQLKLYRVCNTLLMLLLCNKTCARLCCLALKPMLDTGHWTLVMNCARYSLSKKNHWITEIALFLSIEKVDCYRYEFIIPSVARYFFAKLLSLLCCFNRGLNALNKRFNWRTTKE